VALAVEPGVPALVAAAVALAVVPVPVVEEVRSLPVVTVADEGLVGLSVHAVAQSPRPTSKTV
jgi:hypothetical protein